MQDIIKQLIELKDRLMKAWQVVGIDSKKQQVIELQHKMSEPGFWNDQDNAKQISQRASDLEEEVTDWEKIKKDIYDLLEITQLDKDDQTVDLREEATKQLGIFKKKFEQLEFALLFKNKYDHSSSIMAIHAGAGGTDAQDWAEMLLRMYLRFCEIQNWKTQIISLSPGSEAGVKSVLFEVKGRNSYGYLKAEKGVHRLVRISPFDAEKMRHTSFALVEALPHVSDQVEIEVKSEDLKIDTYRASGHGGQGVNTTDSAVRITHLPTKLVATCQNERSQQQNKETAMKILTSKLQQYYEAEKEEEKQRLRGEYTEAAWGNQVRSYVLHPYKMVKDHRTNFEVTDTEAVLNGNILEFIETYLRQEACPDPTKTT
ncbi:peptide chain release factor 2 [Candidatus Falkowbacteria bacterium]|nr:peptide chain release factor 2 [Candidatus Falkowbacteria bacterium]MBT5503644.1 peptide chain release factor 2 [Candidatus Falkowbacteria bacterium]MBT6574108.1 peptide chain release factor 2 [Candidatus Falkowbacteria bacterium]MBT7500686.1 peptide chain release factor 2 [Candidatus Falkowbacteria bacterium]